MTTRRTARTIPAQAVRHADGFTSHIAARELRDATTLVPFWCDCNRKVARGEPLVVASRVGDAFGVHDVLWCSVACRAKRIGGAL